MNYYLLYFNDCKTERPLTRRFDYSPKKYDDEKNAKGRNENFEPDMADQVVFWVKRTETMTMSTTNLFEILKYESLERLKGDD